jgi:hypothetical protein
MSKRFDVQVVGRPFAARQSLFVVLKTLVEALLSGCLVVIDRGELPAIEIRGA